MDVNGATEDFRVFINYRRDDAAAYAGRLYDAAVARFGDANVFIDIDKIAPGSDFVDVIADAIRECGVLLLVIGRSWLGVADDSGARRLDSPDDYVRLEIEAAIEHSVRLIPVLVGGATMPTALSLPESLVPLARRNAFELSDRRWRSDVDALLDAVARLRVIGPDESTLIGMPAVRPAEVVSPPPSDVPLKKKSWRPHRASFAIAAALVLVIGGVAWAASNTDEQPTTVHLANDGKDGTTTTSEGGLDGATTIVGETTIAGAAESSAPTTTRSGRTSINTNTNTDTNANSTGVTVGDGKNGTPASTPTTIGTEPATAPSAPRNFKSANPQAAGAADPHQGPAQTSVDLTWSAPLDNGGAPVTKYRIYRTVMQNGTVLEAAKLVGTITGLGSTVKSDRMGHGSSWVKWEIRAENSAGQGDAATPTIVVPNLVGMSGPDAYQYARNVGLLAGGAPAQDCDRSAEEVCTQNPSANAQVANGTIISLATQT